MSTTSLREARLQSEQNSLLFQAPHLINEFKQPVGFDEPEWKGAKYPDFERLEGQYVYLTPLNVDKHGDELWEVFKEAPDSHYTYLFFGPFQNGDQFKEALVNAMKIADQCYYAIYDKESDKPVGFINLMRIDPRHGCIEVGCVSFSAKLQKNRKGTEVIYLLMKYSFEELGYRRFEWKCDVNNIPSRRAALRFGFSFEGMFRRHIVYRGRARDTAWFSILDDEFVQIMKPSYEEYLDEKNYDGNMVQIKTLPDCREPYRIAYDEKFSTHKISIESPSAISQKE